MSHEPDLRRWARGRGGERGPERRGRSRGEEAMAETRKLWRMADLRKPTDREREEHDITRCPYRG